MKKGIYLVILIFTLTGCRYFNVSPVDGIITKNLKDRPNQQEMVGVWEIDQTSYNLFQEKGYEKKKVELKLNNNGTFELINLPNFVDEFTPSSKKYANKEGTWKIKKDINEKYWVLSLNFNISDTFPNGMFTSYDLYLQKNKIIIWNFIGDPDSGERFLYEKQ
jgi:hypothetical protein